MLNCGERLKNQGMYRLGSVSCKRSCFRLCVRVSKSGMPQFVRGRGRPLTPDKVGRPALFRYLC